MFFRTRRTLVFDCEVASYPSSFLHAERGNEPGGGEEPGDEANCKEEEGASFLLPLQPDNEANR